MFRKLVFSCFLHGCQEKGFIYEANETGTGDRSRALAEGSGAISSIPKG
jgi:hypothetical protein